LKPGTKIRALLLTVRPVDISGLTYAGLESEQVFRLMRNVSAVSEFVQSIVDTHENSEEAQLGREIIRLCADCTVTLAEITSNRVSRKQAEKLTKKLAKTYRAMKEAVTKFGERKDPYWGESVPQLL
jgi:hypothetical protein